MTCVKCKPLPMPWCSETAPKSKQGTIHMVVFERLVTITWLAWSPNGVRIPHSVRSVFHLKTLNDLRSAGHGTAANAHRQRFAARWCAMRRKPAVLPAPLLAWVADGMPSFPSRRIGECGCQQCSHLPRISLFAGTCIHTCTANTHRFYPLGWVRLA